MEIRKIRPYHIDELFEISKQEFKEESWTYDQLLSSIGDDNYICAGLFDEGHLVCYVIAIQSLDDINILSVATKNEYKRQGHATRLLKWYKNLAENVEKTLSLEVKENNEVAKSLYSKLGFKEVSQRKNYYKDGKTAIVMFCELTQ